MRTAQGRPVLVSIERNTIKLEGNASPDDPCIQAKVQREIDYTEAFLKQNIPVSITCYVGGTRCTKQAEMISKLLLRNPRYASLITPHLTCNFSPDDTYQYLRALQSQGIQHILALSGDKLDPSFKTFARDPLLRHAPQLVSIAHLVDKPRRNAPSPHACSLHGNSFDISVAYSSFNGRHPVTEQRKLEQKLIAGACSIKTQPVTYADAGLVDRDLAYLAGCLPLRNISYSVIYYQTTAMAEHIKKKCGITVPQEILNRLHYQDFEGKTDGTSKVRVLNEGLHIAAQSIACLIHSGIERINIMGVRKPETFSKVWMLVPHYLEGYQLPKRAAFTEHQRRAETSGQIKYISNVFSPSNVS